MLLLVAEQHDLVLICVRLLCCSSSASDVALCFCCLADFAALVGIVVLGLVGLQSNFAALHIIRRPFLISSSIIVNACRLIIGTAKMLCLAVRALLGGKVRQGIQSNRSGLVTGLCVCPAADLGTRARLGVRFDVAVQLLELWLNFLAIRLRFFESFEIVLLFDGLALERLHAIIAPPTSWTAALSVSRSRLLLREAGVFLWILSSAEIYLYLRLQLQLDRWVHQVIEKVRVLAVCRLAPISEELSFLAVVLSLEMADQPGHACPYLVAAYAAELVRPVSAIDGQVSF